MKARPYPLPATCLRRHKLRGHRLRRIVAGEGVFGVNGLGLALRNSSNNTLITVLGMLPPALDLHVEDQSLPD